MPTLPRANAGPFLEAYTQGPTAQEVERLFTREAPEASRFFSRTIDHQSLRGLPCHRRARQYIRQLFLAFAMPLAPARRAAYGTALFSSVGGVLELLREMHAVAMPHAPSTKAVSSGWWNRAPGTRPGSWDRPSRRQSSTTAPSVVSWTTLRFW